MSACSSKDPNAKETLYVSILPLKSLIKEIVNEDFTIHTLVPAGASPETFEPTPRQLIGVHKARLVFNVGLINFEQSLMSKMTDEAKVVNLSHGVDLIDGSCSHIHNRICTDGVDPHIWASPKALRIMARNVYDAIHAEWPDSTQYTLAYRQLDEKLRLLDLHTATRIQESGVKHVIVYHPTLTYYARDYNLEQIAIETDGKEPSAKRIADMIAKARKKGIDRIFYQAQFPISCVEVIADDLKARCIEIDPLGEDALANIETITNLITAK